MAKDHDDDSQYESMNDDEFEAACIREFEEAVDADFAKQLGPVVEAFEAKSGKPLIESIQEPASPPSPAPAPPPLTDLVEVVDTKWSEDGLPLQKRKWFEPRKTE